MIQIRLASISDKDNIQSFINKYWKKNHILVLSDNLLDYMYKNQGTKTYNFVLGIDPRLNSINGILGFIPTCKFNSDINSKENIIWFSIWQVLDLPGNKLLGIRLIRYLFKLFPEANFGTVGANKLTLPIYKSLGFKTGSLKTFISPNRNINDFKIARLENVRCNENNSSTQENSIIEITRNFKDYKNMINSIASISRHYKDYEYLKNRYFENPFLDYEIWLLKTSMSNSIFVARRIMYLNRSLLKIADFIGFKKDIIQLVGKLQNKMLKNSEYIEFRSFGLEDQLKSAGFIDLTEDKNIIIPAYHDPFVFKNKAINWSLKEYKEGDYLVTGDCDQDRPNSINRK